MKLNNLNYLVKRTTLFLLMMAVIFTMLPINAYAAGSIDMKNLKTETVYERTYVSTDSLKSIGLSTQINGNTIKLYTNTVSILFTVGFENGSQAFHIADAEQSSLSVVTKYLTNRLIAYTNLTIISFINTGITWVA